MTAICKHCKSELRTIRKGKNFCSASCRQMAYMQRRLDGINRTGAKLKVLSLSDEESGNPSIDGFNDHEDEKTFNTENHEEPLLQANNPSIDETSEASIDGLTPQTAEQKSKRIKYSPEQLRQVNFMRAKFNKPLINESGEPLTKVLSTTKIYCAPNIINHEKEQPQEQEVRIIPLLKSGESFVKGAINPSIDTKPQPSIDGTGGHATRNAFTSLSENEKRQVAEANPSIDASEPLSEEPYTPIKSKLIESVNRELSDFENMKELVDYVQEGILKKEDVNFLNVRALCLVEVLLKISDWREISITDLLELCNAFAALNRSTEMLACLNRYSYSDKLLSIEKKLRQLYAANNNKEVVYVQFQQPLLIELLVMRGELKHMAPRVSYRELGFENLVQKLITKQQKEKEVSEKETERMEKTYVETWRERFHKMKAEKERKASTQNTN